MMRKSQRQGGWLSVEAIFALIIVAGIGTYFHGFYVNSQVEKTAEHAAQHLKTIDRALGEYLKTHWETVAGSVTPTSVTLIDPAELVNGGFLRPGYSLVNPFGQQYALAVTAGPGDTLATVVVGVGGRPGPGTLTGADLNLATRILPEVAQRVGISGGLIPYQTLPGSAPRRIEGVGGYWNLNLDGLSGLGSLAIQPGSLASVNYFVDGALNNDYLHRHNLGIPELNTMRTHIDMDGNDITQVGSLTSMSGFIHTSGDELADDAAGRPVNAFVAERGSLELRDGVVKAGDVYIDDLRIAGRAVPMSRGVYHAVQVNPGDWVNMPRCPPGAVPQIFLSTEQVPVGGNTLRFNSFAQADTTNQRWRVRLQVFQGTSTSGTWNDVPATQGTLVAYTKCT